MMGLNLNVESWLIASVVGFGLGWLWFSPMAFGKHYMTACGIGPDECKNMPGNKKAMTMAVGFLMVLVKLAVLQHLMTLVGATTPMAALTIALWVWAGFIATTSLGGVLWEKKPMTAYLICVTYELALLIVSALIFVHWHH